MDGFQIFLAVCLAIGGIIMFVGATSGGGGKREEAGGDLEARLDNYSKRLNEADSAISELDNLSRDVFAQFDEKYKELLFLYNMIDEKKQGEEAKHGQEKKKGEEKEKGAGRAAEPRGGGASPKPAGRGYTNEKFNKVLGLKKKGYDAEAIAKELKIGKGEVALILELGGR